MRMHTRIMSFAAAIGLLPLVIYGVFATHSAMRGAERSVTGSVLTVANQVSAQVEEFLRGRVDVLTSLAAAIEASPDGARLIMSHGVLADETIRYAALFDPEGDLLDHTMLPPAGLSSHVHEAAEKSLATGNPVSTRVVLGDDLLPVMAVAVPLNLLGEQRGVLAAEVETLEIWELIRGMRLGRTGYAYVLDETGRLIAHGKSRELAKVVSERMGPLPPVISSGGELHEGGLSYERPDGEPVVGAAAMVPDSGWLVVVEMPAAEAFSEARYIRYVLAFVLGGSLALLVGLAWVGARRVTKPIESLAEAANELGRGQFDVRVDESRRDEIGELGAVFNKMAVDLARLSADIRRHERDSMFARVAGGLAHDLKRPLQHIITHIRTFLEMPENPRARRMVEEALDREQAYMDRLFGDLSRISKDDLLEIRPTVPKEVMARARDAVLPTATSLGVSIDLRTDAFAHKPLRLDPVAIERALRNLLENAVDSLSKQGGGKIVASSLLRDGEIVLEVRDDGPGIDERLLPVLFDGFHTSKRSGSGLGLGLAVVRRVAEAHGGRVHAENLDGAGASVRIILPAVEPSN